MLAALFWFIVFGVSLAALVKGADLLVESAEKIALAWGLSPFVAGTLIVGVGTSFPELVSSLVAVWQGAPEIVAANAVGSNVANIALIVGVAAVLGRRLVIEKDLIDLDLPLLAISTVLFLGAAYDGAISFIESLLLLAAYGVYLAYLLTHQEELSEKRRWPRLPSRATRRRAAAKKRPGLSAADGLRLLFGLALLMVGAKYLIDAVIALSDIFQIATGAIAIIAVAVGTSMPELVVSAKAALKRKSEIALGNIFGSNAFNVLVVVGLPGLFGGLTIDSATLWIGIPAMLLATFLFVISGISRRIHLWEGALYLLGYVLFVGKVFKLF